jgi:hypothetical protein
MNAFAVQLHNALTRLLFCTSLYRDLKAPRQNESVDFSIFGTSFNHEDGYHQKQRMAKGVLEMGRGRNRLRSFGRDTPAHYFSPGTLRRLQLQTQTRGPEDSIDL